MGAKGIEGHPMHSPSTAVGVYFWPANRRGSRAKPRPSASVA